ncbi:MAG TPA: hypothetical protein VKA83_09300 [Methylomirabilota bacterium]|nr:hypothetical protein [Methylomirabilota bacterium]
MTSVAAACLYLLMFCPADAIPPAAPPLAHGQGFWAIYKTLPDGTERAETYENADACAADSTVLRDFGHDASICYELL